MIQIKWRKGQSPEKGANYLAPKVSREIARTRRTIPGVMLFPRHRTMIFILIEDLAQLIFDLKNANAQAEISVKLASEIGVGIIAAGVAKGSRSCLDQRM